MLKFEIIWLNQILYSSTCKASKELISTAKFPTCSKVCESAGNGFTNECIIVVLYIPYESTCIQI